IGIPLIATVHGKNYYTEQVKRRMAYRMVSRYANMVAVSEDLKRFLLENVGVAPERLQVVYNGVNPAPHVPREKRDSVKAKLGLSDLDHVVGMVGSLYPVKAHRYLLKAIPRVLAVCPRTVFLLIGRGELEATLKQEAKDLGIEEHVQFLGFRDDVPSILSVMDVFVLPSLSEGLSVALLEAMAAGIPTIATRVGGNPELVIDQRTGFLIPPRDTETLASKLLILLQDKELSRTLGDNGRKRVKDSFSFEAMVNNYQQLYERLLARTEIHSQV
ncbi:MAG: glycosyltransferase, partial [Nitrospirae bacterium]